ncbi:MAG: hypothetical protein JNK04_13970 [Myxococcales bacterium]|nr:hypothetical protein [Myxococcales bacterium]
MTVDREQPDTRDAPLSDGGTPVSAAFVLRWLPHIALFACVTMLVARALVPAMQGWLVGTSRLVDAAELVATTLSYALAFVFIASLIALLLLLLRGRAPVGMRLGGVFLAATAKLALLTTLTLPRLPSLVHMVMAGTACVAGFFFGADATRRGGLVGLVPATVALASALRTVGAYRADRALTERHDLATMNLAFYNAQMLTTIASGFLVVAVVVAVVAMYRVDKRKTGVGFVIALALSAGVSWLVTKPIDDGDGPAAVLLRRFGQELLTRPAPLFDGAFAALLAVLIPSVGLVAVGVGRHKVPAVSGAIALSLLTGASAEIPLLSLGLIVASLGLSIDRRDPSWASPEP